VITVFAFDSMTSDFFFADVQAGSPLSFFLELVEHKRFFREPEPGFECELLLPRRHS